VPSAADVALEENVDVETSAEDLRVLVGLLRLLGRRNQEEMADAAGLHPATVWRYERGPRAPDGPSLEKLVRAAGVPAWAVDGVLLPAIALTRALAAGPSEGLAGLLESPLAEALAAGQSAAGIAGVAEFLASQNPAIVPAPNLDMRRLDRDAAQRVRKAIAMQEPRGIGAELNAGPHLRLVGDLLIDVDVATGL